MPFFQSTPNLPDHEKAKVEFHLQQLATCLGQETLLKPVVIPEEAFGHRAADLSASDILVAVGEHLNFDIRPIEIQIQPQALELCGGGG